MSRFGTIPADTLRKIADLAGDRVPGETFAWTEKGFQTAVTSFARHHGWRVYHTFDSRKSQAGFPDLTLVHRARGLVFAELKVGRNVPTPAQVDWLDDLRAVGVRAYLWHPEDWTEIEAVLGG